MEDIEETDNYHLEDRQLEVGLEDGLVVDHFLLEEDNLVVDHLIILEDNLFVADIYLVKDIILILMVDTVNN